jgi:hypothetical protein
MDLQGRRWRSPRWGIDRAMPHEQVAHSDMPPGCASLIGQRSMSDDNYFGIDIDTYDLVIDASTGTLPIEATSDKDGIRLAVLALAVEVE